MWYKGAFLTAGVVVRHLGFQHDADRARQVVEIGTEGLGGRQEWFPDDSVPLWGSLPHLRPYPGRPLPASARPTRVLRALAVPRSPLYSPRRRLGSVVRRGCLPQVVMETSGLDLVEMHTIGLHTIRSSILSSG